jgi:hypothetical protein
MLALNVIRYFSVHYLLFLWTFFSVPCYANFTENLRWSVDASARLKQNEALDNSSGIYALGLDTDKIFTSSSGNPGYGVG